MAQLQGALEEKDKQLVDGKELFEKLKQDFKYNLRLLQERDDELERGDVTVVQLREQLANQLDRVSELGVKLHESEERCKKFVEEMASKETAHRKQLQIERTDFDRYKSDKMAEHSKEKLDWDSEKRILDEKLEVCNIYIFFPVYKLYLHM